MTQDGLSGVAVIRFIQSDVLHDERGQGAAMSCDSAATACGDTRSGLDSDKNHNTFHGGQLRFGGAAEQKLAVLKVAAPSEPLWELELKI